MLATIIRTQRSTTAYEFGIFFWGGGAGLLNGYADLKLTNDEIVDEHVNYAFLQSWALHGSVGVSSQPSSEWVKGGIQMSSRQFGDICDPARRG